MSDIKTRALAFVCFALGIVAVSSISTQFLADKLAYHPALGAPLFGQIYNPFSWWQWRFDFYNYAPAFHNYAFMIFAAGFLLSIGAMKLYVGLKTRSSKKHEGTHGTARFATYEDVEKTRLINNEKTDTVYCGGYFDEKTGRTHYLRHDGMGHVCVIAPTESGKGVTNVIPTLLSWTKSVLVLDRKGENYALTASWRKKYANNVVLRFEPAAPGSCAWNPLEEIRFKTAYQISEAQNTALMLVDNDGKGIEKDHFRSAAKDLITGLIIHCLYKSSVVGRMPSVPDIAQMLSDEGDFAATSNNENTDDKEQKSLTALFSEMADVTFDDSEVGRAAQSRVRGYGKRFGSTTDRELSGILNTANNALSLYLDPIVALNTSHSDFKTSDLMDHSVPVSLYFIGVPGDASRLRPLERLLLTQVIFTLTGKMEFENGRAKTAHKHLLLLMLDEFPTLGKLDIFESALAYIRGYGIKAYIIIQDIQQLYKEYTNYESILSNCRVQIAYAPQNLQTAKWLSEKCGTTTVIKEQISTSGNRFGGGPLKNVSRSYQEISRPLMTPHETTQLAEMHTTADPDKPGELLVFMAGHPVIRGRQTPYFLDPTFDARSKIPPPKTSDTVHDANPNGFGLK